MYIHDFFQNFLKTFLVWLHGDFTSCVIAPDMSPIKHVPINFFHQTQIHQPIISKKFVSLNKPNLWRTFYPTVTSGQAEVWVFTSNETRCVCSGDTTASSSSQHSRTGFRFLGNFLQPHERHQRSVAAVVSICGVICSLWAGRTRGRNLRRTIRSYRLETGQEDTECIRGQDKHSSGVEAGGRKRGHQGACPTTTRVLFGLRCAIVALWPLITILNKISLQNQLQNFCARNSEESNDTFDRVIRVWLL